MRERENTESDNETQSSLRRGEIIYKAVRICTVPPAGALAAILVSYFYDRAYYGGVGNMILAVVFLTLFPLTGYAAWLIVPALKRGGRKAQRRCAFVASFCGYTLGAIIAFCVGLPSAEKTLFLTYAFSGALTAIFNVCKIKASGHACGVVGPVIFLARFVNAYYLLLLCVLVPVCISSLRLRRHTPVQLCIGAAVPVAAFFSALALCF